MFLNEINAGSDLGTKNHKEITTRVAESHKARAFYDKRLFKRQQIISVNLQDNIVNSLIEDNVAIQSFMKWTRYFAKVEDFKLATDYNDTNWRVEYVAKNIATDLDGPDEFECSMVFICKNNDIAFDVDIKKGSKKSKLFVINEDELKEALDISHYCDHEYPFLNGHTGISQATVNEDMFQYYSGMSADDIFEVFTTSVKLWKIESAVVNQLSEDFTTQKNSLCSMKKELEIEDQTVLDSFMNQSVSLKTIVAPCNVGMRKLRDEKALKTDDYNHFSEWYFRDSKIFYCTYKKDSTIVVVNVRSSKVTTRLIDLDFHMKDLISEIRQRLTERNEISQHISINIVINELPDHGTVLDLITIDGYFEKLTNKKHSIRKRVTSFDFNDHVVDYDKYVFDYKGATKDISPYCDPYKFTSFITEVDTDSSHNLNFFIDSMHKNNLLDKRGIQISAEEYIEANSQDFASMLDNPVDEEVKPRNTEKLYISGLNSGPAPKLECAINLIYADRTVDKNIKLSDAFPETNNVFDEGELISIIDESEMTGIDYQTCLMGMNDKQDTKIVLIHVSCIEDFSSLVIMDLQVERLESIFSKGLEELKIKFLIINIIIDKIPDRSMVLDHLTITNAVQTKTKRGNLSSPNMRSEVVKQSYPTYFSNWNDNTATSGGIRDLGSPWELCTHTVDKTEYTFALMFREANSEIIDIFINER